MSDTNSTAVPPTPKNCGLAIWSLVLGILSLTCFWLFTAIPAVICGHVARGRIKRSGGTLEGGGLALGGLITGYICIGLSLVAIPVMLAVGVPNFIKARDTAMTNACINNLVQIETAKEQWSVEHNKQPGDPVVEAEVNDLMPQKPVCPSGGTYTYGPVGTPPRCSVPGHQLQSN